MRYKGQLRLAFLLTLLALQGTQGVHAQQLFTLVADNTGTEWRPQPNWTADSLDTAVVHARRWLASQGFALARVDSARLDTSGSVVLFATPGPRLLLEKLEIAGASRLAENTLRTLFDTREGEPLQPDVFEADLARVLDAYARAGYGLAQVHVEKLEVSKGNGGHLPGLVVYLRIDEGQSVVLTRIVFEGDTRTRPAYVARLLGLRMGTPLKLFDPVALQQRLDRSGLFARVSVPQLFVDAAGNATLRLGVEESAPGAFDVVVGLLPPAGGQGRASFVGTGHLQLRNLFGLGHEYALKLNRLPGQTSSVAALAAVPFVLGLPLRLEASFDGIQQDSTFGSQRYGGGIAYGEEGREVLITVSRELVKPGVEGARVRGGTQPVPRSSVTFVGIGFRVGRVDFPYNPRRGYVVETLLERGNRARTRTVTDTGSTTRVRTADRQERLTLRARLYQPLGTRVVAALGVDGYALRSAAYEEGELFRFGGATTLRGYDEDRFRVRQAARGLSELRLLLDRLSYAFAFAEVAFVDQPSTADVSSLRGFYSGYGVGVQVSTGVGLVVATYAASPESGLASGRIHLGLSIGL